ncbi:MAG: hypothetical protein WCH40_12120 [Verrucomicrobiales bacterium]
MTATLSITQKFQQLRDESHRAWYDWAHEIASGKPAPHPRALLEVAAVLEIDAAAEALQADADAIREAARLEKAAIALAEDLRNKLKPWGGELSKLDTAINAAAQELRRLQGVRSSWDWTCAESVADDAEQLRKAHARVFQEVK